MSSYVQMSCYEHGGIEDETDSSVLMPSPATLAGNFGPTSADLADNNGGGGAPVTSGGRSTSRDQQAGAQQRRLPSPTVHIRAYPAGSGRRVRWREVWKSRTPLEKSLFLTLCCMVAFNALILFLAFSASEDMRARQKVQQQFQQQNKSIQIFTSSTNNNAAKDETAGCNATGPCMTPACISASAVMMSAMDPTVDPCQDFFQYACGRWIRMNPIPEGKSIWGTFDRLWQDNQVAMKAILEQPPESLQSESEKKAQRYYQSCLDVNETMEALGGQPVLDLLDKIGGWPAIDNAAGRKGRWDFQAALQTAHNVMNMGGFFTWAVAEDDKNSTRHVIQMDQSGLTLPNRDYYLNKTDKDEILNAYLDYMTKVGMLLNSSADPNRTRSHMKDVIELETRIAGITVASSERRDEEKLYHAMTVADLRNLAPFLNWTTYFQSAFDQVNISITPAHTVVVYSPDFLRNLSSILQDLVVTEKGRTMIHNYLGWHVVRSFLSCLPKAFRDAGKILRKLLMGSEGNEETWRSCVTDTNNVMGFAVGAMFVRQNFRGESKPLAESMIAAVKVAFQRNFDRLDWMDEETRKAARDKAEAITDMIGYPKFILNPKELDELYADIEIDADGYFLNNVRSNQFSLRQNLVKLNEPVNKTLWGMTPSTVNAYYTPNKNQIVFPAGILQQPFFDTSYPEALNFGAMGVVMGHELTHAFDDQGREFDRDGDLAPWWNNATIERFQQRTECLVQQYTSYTINGQPLNGKQTLGENIADNGGLKAAYHAFGNWSSGSSSKLDENILPGLNLTHRQLFFLAFAQVWCSSSTKEAIHLQILNDPHSPARYRVMGPLSNLPEFSSVFQCPAGSPMNPKSKCEIW